MNKKKTMLLLVTIIGLMLFGIVGCNKGSKSSDKSVTIDLNKYMSVNVTGYNSMGTAEVSFDYDAFEKDYKDKIKAKTNNGNDEEINLELKLGTKPMSVFNNYCVGYEADKTSELSNGDVIKITWNCDDESAKSYFGCKLKYSDIEYKVEGLEEIATFDSFEYVKVEFEGAAPYGKVNIKADTEKKEMQYVEFSVDKEYDLSNGDKVVVTANVKNIDRFIEEFNAIPNPSSKEYTVEGLPTYAKSMSDFSEDAFNEIKSKAEEIYKAKWQKLEGNMDGLKNLTYVGNYFLTKKEENGILNANQIYMLYKVDAEFEGKTYPHYIFIKFVDVAINAEGNCEADFNNYEEVSNRYKPTGDWGFYYFGYGTLDDLFNDTVGKVTNSYLYDKNITE